MFVAPEPPDAERRLRGKVKRASLFRSAIGLVAFLSLGYVVPSVPWRVIGGVLIVIGVVVTVPVLWSMRGARIRDWGLAPATAPQMVGILTGAALVIFGIALIAMSVVDLRSDEWELALVMAPATFLGMYAAITFMSLASLIRRGRG